MSVDYREITILASEIAEILDADVRDVVTKIGFDLHTDVTFLSPVDSGRYRAAWHLSESVPSDWVPPKGEYPVPMVAKMKATKPWPVMWLQNNVPYAVSIEDGHSTVKAPDGVLSVAMIRAQLQGIAL